MSRLKRRTLARLRAKKVLRNGMMRAEVGESETGRGLQAILEATKSFGKSALTWLENEAYGSISAIFPGKRRGVF